MNPIELGAKLTDANQNQPEEHYYRTPMPPRPPDMSRVSPEFLAQARALGLLGDAGIPVNPVTEAHAETPLASVAVGDKQQQFTPPSVLNRYAPTGWRKKHSIEFDYQTPSGQVCRLRRLERNDIIKLKLIDHMDDLLPKLIDIGDATPEKITEALKDNMHLIDGLYNAADVVVMACCVRPMVTSDPNLVSYGTEADELDPNFVAVVSLDDIDIEDRMAIFLAAFGSDAAGLKSVSPEATSMESVPASENIQLSTQPAN